MNEGYVTVPVQVTEEMYRSISKIAQREGCTVEDLVRQAVRELSIDWHEGEWLDDGRGTE